MLCSWLPEHRNGEIYSRSPRSVWLREKALLNSASTQSFSYCDTNQKPTFVFISQEYYCKMQEKFLDSLGSVKKSQLISFWINTRAWSRYLKVKKKKKEGEGMVNFKLSHNFSLLCPFTGEKTSCVKHSFHSTMWKGQSYILWRLQTWVRFVFFLCWMFLEVRDPGRQRNNCCNEHPGKHWPHNRKRYHLFRNWGTRKDSIS